MERQTCFTCPLFFKFRKYRLRTNTYTERWSTKHKENSVGKIEEEVYTYDERTEKGMARVKTADDMWQYLASDSGRHKREF